MTIEERIKEVVRRNRTTLNAICEGDMAIQAKMSRQVNRGSALTADVIMYILNKFPEVSADWLMRGIEPTEECLPVITNNPEEGSPYYDVDFLGGFAEMENNQSVTPAYYINMPPYNKQGVVWCNLIGNSMQPAINNGDMIALQEVKDWKDYINFGEIYAIVTNNELRTVKVIRKGKDDDHYRLVPLNTTDFDEQSIPVKTIKCVYKVLASVRRF